MNDNTDKEKQDNEVIHSKCLRCYELYRGRKR